MAKHEADSERSTIVDYQAKQPTARVWGLSRPAWMLVAGFCALVELAGCFATNGRMNGWANIAFVALFAAIGLVALINALRPVRRAE